MCGVSDNIEHCYMLPSIWKDLLEYEKIGDKICANFQNACCTPIEFFVEENLGNWHPITQGPCNYLRSFDLDALIHKYRKTNNIHMLRFEILLETEGQDHVRKKMITMKLFRLLLMIKRHPNIRKVFNEIKMPSSMNLWSGNVVIFWRRMKFFLSEEISSSICIISIVLIPEFKLGQIISSAA